MHPDDIELDLALESDEPPADPAGTDDPLGDVVLRSGVPLFERPTERSARPSPAESRSLFPSAGEALAAAESEPAAAEIAAPLSGRVTALATDAILCALWSAAALVGAALATGRALPSAAWIWAGAFAILLSFFLVVPTLLIFGRTPGMALADLTAAASGEGGPPAGACAVRWAATAATVALAGLPLLAVAFDASRRTPADRLSGWPLRQL